MLTRLVRGLLGFTLGAILVAVPTLFIADNILPMAFWLVFNIGVLVTTLIFGAFGRVDIGKYQAGGHCGCCGAWVADQILEKDWPFTLCQKCADNNGKHECIGAGCPTCWTMAGAKRRI